MTKYIKFCLLTLSLVFAFTAITFAQQTVGTVEGTVKDEKGAVVPGVEVTISGISVGLNRKVQTDGEGNYRFQQIPPGVYKITTAASNGFAAGQLESVTVAIEKVTTADVTLGISQGVNTVEVSTDPLGVAIDPGSSKVQTNITSQLIDQLPKGGSFTSLLKVSPGTRSEPLSGGFQVDGASGSENTFVIDGQALENFRTGALNGNNNIPTSLVSEIQIKTGGFEAEHGGASGGVISVVTKSGSDVWHGDFGTTFEDSKLQPGPRFATTRFVNSSSTQAAILANPDFVYAIRQQKDNYLNSYPTASLGGAIIKKRVWFYGNYSPQIFQTNRTSNFINAFGTNTTSNSYFTSTGQLVLTPRITNGVAQAPIEYKQTQKYEYAFGRVDAQIFNSLRVSSTYLWNPLITNGTIPFASITTSNPVDTNLNGVIIPSAPYYRLTGGRQNSDNFTAQGIYTPTSKLVVNVRYGHAFLNEKPANYAIANATRYVCSGSSAAYNTISTGCPGGIGYQNLSTNSLVTRDVSLKNEVNGDVSYYLGNFGGSHNFKGGYQYGTTKNDVLSGYAGTGIVQLFYGQDYGQAGTGVSLPCALGTASCLGVGTLTRIGAFGVASNKYQALFIQDQYQPIKRLTLNLGVRAEKENLPSFNGNQGTAPINFSFKDKIAPRLGGAYDIFGDGKTKVFASYGWFYDRLKFELPRGSFGGNFYRVDYFPITAANPGYASYTPSRILGTFTDPIGGGNPSTTGGISQLQRDFRIPSNLSTAQKTALGLPTGPGVAPDLKPFRQSEVTIGAERELSRLYILSVRLTRKNVDHAIEDHAVLGLNESENYYIGNPGEGTDAAADIAAGYAKTAKPQRLYKGLEVSLNKRLSNHYFFNVNYTLSKLYGNYSGLASSDEASTTTTIGRQSPGVNRFFDYIINGFTATGQPDNGYLATDRRHAFKAYGGYNFDWFGSKTNETELSFFQQALQGTPLTTFITVFATSIPLSGRGDLGRTKPFYQTDLTLTHRYRFGRDARYTVAVNIDALNVFNNNSPLQYNTVRYRTLNTISASDIDPTYDGTKQTLTSVLNRILNGQIGTQISQLQNGGLPGLSGRTNPISSTYGSPINFQAPRLIRLGMRFYF